MKRKQAIYLTKRDIFNLLRNNAKYGYVPYDDYDVSLSFDEDSKEIVISWFENKDDDD